MRVCQDALELCMLAAAISSLPVERRLLPNQLKTRAPRPPQDPPTPRPLPPDHPSEAPRDLKTVWAGGPCD